MKSSELAAMTARTEKAEAELARLRAELVAMKEASK
jgi:hypothetical protein